MAGVVGEMTATCSYSPTDVVGEMTGSGDPPRYAVARSGLPRLNGSPENLEEEKVFFVSAIKN